MDLFRRCCFVVVAVLAFASDVFGDGVYIPERAVRKIPEIPAQRAVLAWKDGQETLVISSALDSESQKLGWIIPLPSVPTTIEKQSPGALKTLNFCIQPEITHDLHLRTVAAIVVAFVGNLVVATWLFKREKMLSLLVLLTIVFVLYSLMLPASGSATVAKAANVQVEKSVSVGAYDIRVLKPAKPDDLNAWLADNGFSALPAAADRTVADYISNGWVFATIKLTRAESGSNAPHPIKMTFSSKEPVYPLKLTSLAGGSTAFEIFVIADDRAACHLLKEEFCERFTAEKWTRNDEDFYEAGTYFKDETPRLQIGHPAICSLMWNDCILTKFAGTIDADKMTSDIQFGWTPFKPYRQHFYTTQGAKAFALLVFICFLGGCLAVSMVVCKELIVQPRGLWRYLGRVLLPAAVFVAVLAVGVFASLPKLDASEVVVGNAWRQQMSPWSVLGSFERALEDRPDILQGSENAIAERLLKYVSGPGRQPAMTNQLTGTELIVEDSPGNFTVEKSPEKVIIRVYDASGRAMVVQQPKTVRNKQGRAGQGGSEK